MNNRLYLALESTSRELEAKAFLACCAAVRGMDVILGHEDMIRRYAVLSKPGVFFDTSMHTEYPPLFRKLRKLGHRIVVNDEEGLVIIPERYVPFAFPQEADRVVDCFFAWGDYQRELLCQALPNMCAKAFSIGNARIDLLRPELREFHAEDVARIKARYGDFVLINSRFGAVNNVAGETKYQARIRTGKYGPTDFMLRSIAHDQLLFVEFQKMLEILCDRYPDRQFVFRPHPNEKVSTWREIAKGRKNLHVVREGNVHQWILASDLVIQSGCGTAVESYFLGAPCISYHPVVAEDIVRDLPDGVSYLAYDIEELCQFIEGNREAEQNALRPKWKATAEHYVAATSGRMATDRMIDKLIELEASVGKKEFTYWIPAKMNAWFRHYNRSFKAWLRTIRGKVKKKEEDAQWVALTREQFETLICRFGFYDSRFAQLEVTQVYNNCFRLRNSG